MEHREWLAGEFETLRPRLQSVAYSILGSLSDAEDAVQECWLRLDRSDATNVADLQGWLTTVVGRICLHAPTTPEPSGEPVRRLAPGAHRRGR